MLISDLLFRASSACVNAKSIATLNVHRCKAHDDCSKGGVCVWATPESSLTLIPLEIDRPGRGKGVVLFLGSPYELFGSVSVSLWR